MSIHLCFKCMRGKCVRLSSLQWFLLHCVKWGYLHWMTLQHLIPAEYNCKYNCCISSSLHYWRQGQSRQTTMHPVPRLRHPRSLSIQRNIYFSLIHIFCSTWDIPSTSQLLKCENHPFHSTCYRGDVRFSTRSGMLHLTWRLRSKHIYR